jgi:hypothetical protein
MNIELMKRNRAKLEQKSTLLLMNSLRQSAAISPMSLRRAKWRELKARALAVINKFDPDEPRDPSGKWTAGGGDGGSDDSKPAQGELFPELPPLPPAKGKNKLDDFAKDQVTLASDVRSDKEKADKFLEHWNENVREAPAEFKKEFLGGMPATMTIKSNDNGDVWTLTGKLQDADGASIGEYTRTIDFAENRAESDYFKLNKTGGGLGKQMLAANVAMYQKLGLSEVEVHANIDVGGYAWAKYGYVPTDESWRNLSGSINDKIDELAGGGSGYEPSSWEEMSEDQHDSVFNAWARASEDEFYESEVENWRDSGGDLAQAKQNLADTFLASSTWARNALEGHTITVGEGDNEKAVKVASLIPIDTLLENTTVDFKDRRGDGNEDPDITIDDHTTSQLTDDQREQVESILVGGFNKQAESDASDVEPPPHFHDNIRDSQSEYWSSMRDRDKFRWASDNGELPEETSGSGEIDEADAQELRELADDSDPKAVWAIADSEHGKDVLLNSDWVGVLDLHDSETMARFNAYVNKKPKA